MKKLFFIFALLSVSLTSWAIDWNNYEWLGDGAGGGAYSNKYKVAPAAGQSVVNIQQPGWASEPGIYTSDFGGAISSCSLGSNKCAIDGGGVVLYLSAFTNQETEVTVVAAQGSKTFTVYYKDGTPAVADTEKPVMTSATCSSTTHNSATIAVAATDNVGVTKYVVRNGGDEHGEYAPNAGVIVVEDLSASTNYTLTIFAKDAAGNVSASGIDVACNTTAIPSSPYCNTEIAHFDNPIDDSYILLSVGSDGLGHTIVNIKQDNAKNTNTFDYINIVGKKEIGSDIATGGAAEMAIVFNTPTPDGDGNITFTMQWSKVGDGGRWQHEITVPADATCASADPFPGEHMYCKYTDNDLRREGANVSLTWATNNDGDVEISLADGEGAHNTHFRNEGFEYGGGKTMDDSWFVYSGTNHVVGELASKYFTVEPGVNGGNLYALRLKNGETVPTSAVVAFLGHAFSWKNDEAPGAYTENKVFAYTYGAACPFLATPTNVAVNNTKHITFDGVANAQTYTALVYLDGILKHRQVVSSGDELTFVPYTTETYQVKVTASAEGYPTSDPSEAYDWALTAPSVVVGNSEYCEWALPTFVADAVNCDANLTIETGDNGNITVTLSPLAEQTAVFREQGMKLSDFTVGEVRVAAAEYFSRIYSAGGSTVVLILKDSNIKPGLGEKIYFSGYVECTVNGHSTWPTASLTYTYGSKCSGQKHVSVAANSNEWGSATVNGETAVDVDEGTQVTCVATPNEGYDFVNWTQGGIEVATTSEYTMTVTANTALVANFETHRTEYCSTLLSDGSHSSELYVSITNPSGNTYKILVEGTASQKIESAYNNFSFTLSHINGESGNTNLPAASWTTDNSGYGSAYVTFTATDFREITFVNRYIVLNKQGGELIEFNAFPDASAIKWNATCTDTEVPVLAEPVATPLSGTSVRLAVSATDDMAAVLTYTVNYKPEGDAGAGTNVQFSGTEGEVTYYNISGLTTGVRYQFAVSVSDGTNTSAAQICYAKPTMPTAPVPTRNAAFVRSIYSNAYTSVITSNYGKNSYSGISYQEVNVGGDNFILYDYSVPKEIVWGADNQNSDAILAATEYTDGEHLGLDVREMNYIHFDVFSVTATTHPSLYVQSAQYHFSVDNSGWQSFDIDISGMDPEVARSVTMLKFNDFSNPHPEEIAIDNVYFWSYGTQTTPIMGGDAETGGWATFAASEKVAVPEGLTAYKAEYQKTATEELLVLTDIGDVIPANYGVILKGTANTVYTFAPTSDPEGNVSGNALVGCPTRTDISSVAANNDIFCLRYSELYSLTGFFLYTGQYIPAGKVYLPIPKDPGGAGLPQRKIRFVFRNEQTTTGIENADAEAVQATKFMENGQLFIRRGDAVYTIQGARVK